MHYVSKVQVFFLDGEKQTVNGVQNKVTKEIETHLLVTKLILNLAFIDRNQMVLTNVQHSNGDRIGTFSLRIKFNLISFI